MTFSALKDPDAVLDYKIDWTLVLQSVTPTDTIATSTWVADNGLVVDSDSNTTTDTTVWVSAGTLGTISKLVNTITTAGGRTHVRTINVSLRDT